MKIRLIDGLKARVRVWCAAVLCGLMAAAAVSCVVAQENAAAQLTNEAVAAAAVEEAAFPATEPPLEANATAALAFLNTLLASAAAILAWGVTEKLTKRSFSALGVASGAVAGLVGITPAAGSVGPFGAIAIGVAAGVICVWGVTGLKRMLGADDSLDVFGVHGIGGIVGALLTGVFTAPNLGGTGGEDFSIASQVGIQAIGVGLTIVWIGVVSVIAFLVARLVFGLRVSEDAEREGLDITSHGESAYEV